jgi:hypothetical protein
MKINYDDFYLHVGWPDTSGLYPIQVVQSPRGETRQPVWQKNNLNIPQFNNILDYINELIAEPDEVEELGRSLHRFLFPQEVYDLFKRCREGTINGIRLRLRIDPEELSILPWEFCFDDETKQFLALERKTPITRYIAGSYASPTTLSMPKPIKMLVVLASPRDQPELDMDKEERGIRAALKDIPIELSILHHATGEKLHNSLLEIEPQILHFSGHGVLKDGLGALALENPETGTTDPLNAKQIRGLVNRMGITMAVLNACETAKHSTRDALMGVAQSLIREEIPAVIAMQFLVSETVALMFTRRLYDFLFRGESLEQIVTETRVGIDINFENDRISWGIPVLFMRSKDGLLWKPTSIRRGSGLYSLKTEDLKVLPAFPSTQVVTTETILMKKIYREWVDDVLLTAIPNAERRIRIKLQRESDGSLVDKQSFLSVFDEMDNCFLLLGEPGSGKTIILCELVRELILRARTDENQPIPVFLRLATWCSKDGYDLSDWINDQIQIKYGLGRTHIEDIKKRGTLLLLDGLDEVRINERSSCVEAINNFCVNEGWINIVVTCRFAEYTRLRNSQAELSIPKNQIINILPIDTQEINQFLKILDLVGVDVAHLQSLLKNESTPLMTDVILQTYEGKSEDEIKDVQLSDIWENYILRKHEDENNRCIIVGTSPPYPLEDIKKWLKWLSRKLKKHTQDAHRFYLEEMQPDWLSNKGVLLFYLFGFMCLLATASIAIHFEIRTFLPMLYGEIGVQNLFNKFNWIVGPLGTLWVALFIWYMARRSSNRIGLIIFGILSGLVLGSMVWIPYSEMPILAIVSGAITTLTTIFLLRKIINILGFKSKIVCVKRKKWNWKKAFNGLFVGAIVVILIGLISDVSRTMFFEGLGIKLALGKAFSFNSIIWWNWDLPGLLCWGLLFFLVFGLSWGDLVLREEVDSPNQGIIDSGRNGIMIGLSGIIAGLVYSLGIGIPCFLGLGWNEINGACVSGDVNSLLRGLCVGLASGALLGLVLGLIFGGFAWIQHYLVRGLLYFENKQIPWKLEKFLEYASKLNLLRVVGGGYEFIDQELQWHFENMDVG